MATDKPIYANLPAVRLVKVGITGTGATDPVKRYGPGITVTRTAAGVFKFVFAQHPGVYLGFRHSLRADTPGDVKGHTVTGTTYTAPSGSTPGFTTLSLWSSTFAADDLQLLEYLDVTFEFSELSLAASG
jgi:hypothetical protein